MGIPNKKEIFSKFEGKIEKKKKTFEVFKLSLVEN